MKTLKAYALLGMFAAALLFAGCSKDDDDTQIYPAYNDLNSAEKAGIIEMVETEKLHPRFVPINECAKSLSVI